MADFYQSLADIVAPAHTALLVVDMQRDFCDPQGRLAAKGYDSSPVERMMPVFRDFITAARRHGVTIVFARMVQGEAYASGPLRELTARHNAGPYACLEGTPGADFMPGFEPESGDIVITKHRYNAFNGTGLEDILRERGIETLIVGGVATNVCVESTCRDGFMRDFYVVVGADLTACGSEERQQQSLFNLNRYFGLVTTSRKIMAAWNA